MTKKLTKEEIQLVEEAFRRGKHPYYFEEIDGFVFGNGRSFVEHDAIRALIKGLENFLENASEEQIRFENFVGLLEEYRQLADKWLKQISEDGLHKLYDCYEDLGDAYIESIASAEEKELINEFSSYYQQKFKR